MASTARRNSCSTRASTRKTERSFYDERGVHPEPRFSIPTRRGGLLGFIGRVKSGAYDLIPAPGADVDSFALALYEAQCSNRINVASLAGRPEGCTIRKGVQVEVEPKEI